MTMLIVRRRIPRKEQEYVREPRKEREYVRDEKEGPGGECKE